MITCPALAEGFETSVGVPRLAEASIAENSTTGRVGSDGAAISAQPPAVVTRIGPVTASGATAVNVSFRLPETSNGELLVAWSAIEMPPTVNVVAPSMKPEPCSVNRNSLPGRPSMPDSVGTICSGMPAEARKVCTARTSEEFASDSDKTD